MSNIRSEIKAGIGLITLDRPKALNALSLEMVRDLYTVLVAWRDNPEVEAVAIRGSNKEGPFGAFCAGGDIRFFHSAAVANDSALEDFFTEEYRLNHLDFYLPQTLYRLYGRHSDGRWYGHQSRGLTTHSHRAQQAGHARDQYRPVSRCGRWLLFKPLPRRQRRVSGSYRAGDAGCRCHYSGAS